MREFWRMASRSAYIPLFETMERTTRALSLSGKVFFFFFAGLCVVSSAALLLILNDSFLTPTPAQGGSLREGIVGTPRFINPLLAASDADRDLTALIYSGLLRATPEGNYTGDLAKSYEISPDGKTYTFTLRDDATFHNGMPVTADDVLFTIEMVKNATLKSPRRGSWDGVVAEKDGDHVVHLKLQNPYVPFIENTTMGILPKNLWQNLSPDEFAFSDLNSEPVGSGPFSLSSVKRSQAGIPESYELKAFANYTKGKPYLNSINLYFYQSEQELVDALLSGEIETISGVSPSLLPEEEPVTRAPLGRVFAVFFNQNQSALLRDATVRAALDEAIDREELIEVVLEGFGTPLEGPLPQASIKNASKLSREERLSKAQGRLIAAGWEMKEGVMTKTVGSGKNQETTTLAFSLTTGNVPELRKAAEYVREHWSALGARVDVQIFDQGDLSQNVIRPRKYDALLFGEVIGREPDLYAFWHSSQRNDPGLNIALYANTLADSLLEKMRTTTSEDERANLYKDFLTELEKDRPALFLYAPDFVYSVPDDLKGLDLGSIGVPSDRFLTVASWHRQTDYVWPFFSQSR